MSRSDALLHVRGEALFVGDIAPPARTLHAAVFASPLAHGRILKLDAAPALACPGVLAVLTARDIPGENQIGNILPDEALLAEDAVQYVGQAVALVVAETAEAARLARDAIRAEFEPLEAVFDPREAFRLGRLIQPPRTFALGDVDAAFAASPVVVEGRADTGAQEHAYLETQCALAIPLEQGGVKLWSATQSPSGVQRAAARVLGLAMHLVQVEVPRLGGGFGGKEEQATGWAALAALAAARLRRPVRLELRRDEDMRWTGKRHPYSADFKLGLDREGRILAYEAQFYQNAGAVADLSTAILERSLFHAGNGYFLPAARISAASCRTNLPPNTAFRGFGGPQAMFVLEAAIHQAACALGLDAAAIQEKNLLKQGDAFPYGQRVERCRARACWDEAKTRYGLEQQRGRIRQFNAGHALEKKGLALMPICFGISFTSTFLNQAQALVHVYADGSVGVSHSAVEMGQGVKEKMRQVAAQTLGLEVPRIKVENTDTTRTANMPPTAASVGADLNGQAVRAACLAILARLKPLAAGLLQTEAGRRLELRDETVCLDGVDTGLSWGELVGQAFLHRINLSAQAHYATPDIHFDREREQGRPFAYHVFGTAWVEATLDCLRGTYRFSKVEAVHDCGQSLAPLIDLGQVEGGIVQGLGWIGLEEIRHDGQGRLLTADLSTYKIPDIHFAPDMAVHFLADADNPPGLLNSKAVGEPPFMYGIGGYFALLEAMRAFRPDVQLRYDVPWTPEKVLMALYAKD